MNSPVFNCRVFETNDLEEMAEVLGESFSLGEPMAAAVRLSKKDIQAIVKLFGPKAAAEQVGVVARSTKGQVVGALLAQDFATPPPDGMERMPAAFNPIGALIRRPGRIVPPNPEDPTRRIPSSFHAGSFQQ